MSFPSIEDLSQNWRNISFSLKKKKKTLPHSYHSKSKCLNVVLSANDDVCMTGEMKQNVSEMCANLNVI